MKAQGTASEESRTKEREGDRYVSWTPREWLKKPLAQVFSASRSGNIWTKEGIHWTKEGIHWTKEGIHWLKKE